MGKPHRKEDKMLNSLRGLNPWFEGTQDVILELDINANHSMQMIIEKEAEIDTEKGTSHNINLEE